MGEPIVVTRPPKLPDWILRRARESGKAPEQVIADAIAAYPTFDEAAYDLGIHRDTLRIWRKRFRIEVF